MAAPPVPTAEEWAFASRYTLKNSKAYRHTWAQHVRSQMGTAVEGPDQGLVRFRVEISPDGNVASLQTLWSTSPEAERRARAAVAAMPRWPATPTGQPLVFERTIAFTPDGVDGPPVYRDDCLPDPPVFRNPYAWNGNPETAGQLRGPSLGLPPSSPQDPQDLADCLKQLPPDSVEAVVAEDRRLMERWNFGGKSR
jgi:TonB family protein